LDAMSSAMGRMWGQESDDIGNLGCVEALR
jgi:hypothetical protein